MDNRQRDIQLLFFELLKISVGRIGIMTREPEIEEWYQLFRIVREHALVGVCSTAVERMSVSCRPPRELLVKWGFMVGKVIQWNRILDNRCSELTMELDKAGFDSCVLKGQGIARLYPVSQFRQCGDIDLWVWPKNKSVKSWSDYVHSIVRYADGNKGSGKDYSLEVRYHHVEMPTEDGLSVELHYRPAYMYSPLRNNRLQHWFCENRKDLVRYEDINSYVPSVSFNIIFILTHIYRHLFEDGIGLRQVMDYYYVVLSYNREQLAAEAGVKKNMETKTLSALRNLGLYSMARAMMFVLHEVFGLSEDEMIVPQNKDIGRFVLDEIMKAGNFGNYDSRTNHSLKQSSLGWFYLKLKRSARLLRYFPEESMSCLYFNTYQRLWRIRHKQSV